MRFVSASFTAFFRDTPPECSVAAMTELTLHVLPPSHPCMTAEEALRGKGLRYEKVSLTPAPHNAEMERIYGSGRRTVTGILVDREPVKGTLPMLEWLVRDTPYPQLYPSDPVREAELWGKRELQDLGRRLPWGALHFRPEAMGTFGGAGMLDPAGTDFAIRYVRASWKYHRITAEQLAADLTGLPEKLDHVEQLAAEGVIGGEQANAADLQIGSTLRVLLNVGDVAPLVGEAGERIARRWFADYPGDIPAGAFPAGWVPTR